jgi:hypothetical protein
MGNNDLWIAAHAKAAKLVLVTNNKREACPRFVQRWSLGARRQINLVTAWFILAERTLTTPFWQNEPKPRDSSVLAERTQALWPRDFILAERTQTSLVTP